MKEILCFMTTQKFLKCPGNVKYLLQFHLPDLENTYIPVMF